MPYRRLPLAAMFNVRDLGGYPAKGGVTKFGVFLRAEAPCALPERDIRALLDYGVTTSVDFRGDREVTERPSSLMGVSGIAYFRSPTFDDQVAFGARKSRPGPAVTNFVAWGEKYAEMAEHCTVWVQKTLELLARASGCAVYNCTTGKDRTGIITALLLGLACVPDEDIIADYCVSEVYLQTVYLPLLEEYNRRFVGETPAALSDPFFRTEPKNMAALLSHLREKYGGVEPYLARAGVSDETIAALREKLVE